MKDIKGYEGLYAVTSCGKVWSYKSNRFLGNNLDKDGYCRATLFKEGQRKTYKTHRLIAEAYIPNPENKPQINHKDENKQNNCINNLEWATAKENTNYGTRNQRAGEAIGKKRSKKVYCVELDKVFDSMTQAQKELNINNISACCRGIYKTAGGYHWEYVEVKA